MVFILLHQSILLDKLILGISQLLRLEVTHFIKVTNVVLQKPVNTFRQLTKANDLHYFNVMLL